jgi:hypothetical protein
MQSITDHLHYKLYIMAKLDAEFSFTGKIGNLSAYHRKGSKQVILRQAGGPSKNKIKKDPAFAKQRRHNMEFGGCASGTRCIRKAMFPLQQLGSGDFTGILNKMNRSLLVLDTTSEFGKRNIYFSKSPKLYEGFQLNDTNSFDSIVRNPLPYKIDKDTLSAEINFPALKPGINFFVPPGNHPVYSFIATIGIVPDMIYSNGKYKPLSHAVSGMAQSAWYPTLKGSPAIELRPNLASLSLTQTPATPFTLMLSVGIYFGTIGINNEIEQVKKKGAAKILAMECCYLLRTSQSR